MGIHFNKKFYAFINRADDDSENIVTQVSHKKISSKIFDQFQKALLYKVDSEMREAELGEKQKTFLEYGKAAGLALAFYHVRARCANVDCKLSDNAFVDYSSKCSIEM